MRKEQLLRRALRVQKMIRKKKTDRGIIWHIYHTILALLLLGVLVVEGIELFMWRNLWMY